jgi:hypothetical protein
VHQPLNGICPYFTMFPLSFPLRVLKRHRTARVVLDPFCGRGTTLLAARMQRVAGYGMDSSRVAAAIAKSKLVRADPSAVVRAAQSILSQRLAVDIPDGPFWRAAFHPTTLEDLCRLRTALNDDSRSDARIALRAILMGALHGPLGKQVQSYLSNQCPRTYAPKPAYAMRFWRSRNLRAPRVDVLALIERRAYRHFAEVPLSS